ncbi:MAG: NAD(P)H-binding protein [Pseudomonadota bacterium]
MQSTTGNTNQFLIIGGTGKTGRRVAERLKKRGYSVRVGSRSGEPKFDWNLEETWAPCLEGVEGVYITYAPDLAMPGATDAIEALTKLAVSIGVQRLVLLSGRGEEEAQACERIVQNSGIEWTIVRASWFNQNFSEGAFVDMVREGTIALPAGEQREPFVDVDDIADVAAAALTDSVHAGQVYEVTGPRLMSLEDIAADLSSATGRKISYRAIPHDSFVSGLTNSGAPKEVIWMLDYLFSTVLDGRNASLADGVQRALGRQPKDFADYARESARRGTWSASL